MSEPPTQGPQFDAQLVPGESGDEELLAKLERWDRDIETKRGAWREDAEAWYNLEAGNQWTEDDIALLEERGRVPAVFNLVAPTIDAVCGAEIQNRQQAQYYPRERGDTGVSDALTQGVDYISDKCNGDMEDSDAFRDVLICGEGWTLTAPEVDGKTVEIPKGRVDPLEMGVDPASRKACYEDARYLRRNIPMTQDEFEEFRREIGKPDADADGMVLSIGKRVTVVDPRRRYKNGTLGTGAEDNVIVQEWQWWEKLPVTLAAMPDPDQPGVIKIVELDDDRFSLAREIMAGQGEQLKYTKTTKKVYSRAFVGGGEVLMRESLPEAKFRYQAMTGKRDRNRGTYYGLVRPMADPQRFVNKLYSEVMHLFRTNAKGGLAVEAGAVDDVRAFEESWAQGDSITWLKDGALSGANGSRIMPKTAPPIPTAVFQMMEFARDMVRACTGVNEEILGLAGREQPGVLEAQRKQAAYGILGPYFDGKRRYTRNWGELFLRMMREYLPKDTLLRIVDKGTQKYVELAYTMDAEEYDVVVDEAPNTPNQKARVASALLPLIPQMLEAGLIGPEEVAMTLEYMDLPASLVTELQAGIRKRQEAQVADPEQAELAKQAATVELENKMADTEQKRATAFQKATDAHATHAQMARDVLTPPPIEAPETEAPEIA